ncbi:MAG: hypothetical protein EZS28_047935 [Streblomastix strix]|uniref:Transcription factor CBF/NF-Y/archaeal histone domain-containing protein n=1 Tax=Streblomastix strix TaxID=222440 RepID=A0A5J4TE96_9EUKA|nr:MAG: hypothetical protein EZS28_047935 [Streblomastix strix]
MMKKAEQDESERLESIHEGIDESGEGCIANNNKKICVANLFEFYSLIHLDPDTSEEEVATPAAPKLALRGIAKRVIHSIDPTFKISAAAAKQLSDIAETFVHFLACAAHDMASMEGRSTIGIDEVRSALENCGQSYLITKINESNTK